MVLSPFSTWAAGGAAGSNSTRMLTFPTTETAAKMVHQNSNMLRLRLLSGPTARSKEQGEMIRVLPEGLWNVQQG